MEILSALSNEIRAKLGSADSVPLEDREPILMQLMLFEELKAEFKTMSEEKEKLKCQNGKLKEKLEEVKKSSSSLKSQVADLQKSNSLAEVRILELERTIQAQQANIKMLQKEVKLLGKKPMTECAEFVSTSKLQSAERLGFLLPVNNEQSLWVQFKREKYVMKCSSCGSRNHSRSRCSSPMSKNLENAPASAQIYYQKDGNRSGLKRNQHMGPTTNSHMICSSSKEPQSSLDRSSVSQCIRKHRRRVTNLRTSSNPLSFSENVVASNSIIDVKVSDTCTIQPLSGLMEKKKPSLVRHSTICMRYSHHFRDRVGRYVERYDKENQSTKDAEDQSRRAGRKHKGIGWAEDWWLLKCRRFGHLYSNCSHVLEKDLLSSFS